MITAIITYNNTTSRVVLKSIHAVQLINMGQTSDNTKTLQLGQTTAAVCTVN